MSFVRIFVFTQNRLFNRIESNSQSITESKRMQGSGTEAIRTQIQPSKPKREITSITNITETITIRSAIQFSFVYVIHIVIVVEMPSSVK